MKSTKTKSQGSQLVKKSPSISAKSEVAGGILKHLMEHEDHEFMKLSKDEARMAVQVLTGEDPDPDSFGSPNAAAFKGYATRTSPKSLPVHADIVNTNSGTLSFGCALFTDNPQTPLGLLEKRTSDTLGWDQDFNGLQQEASQFTKGAFGWDLLKPSAVPKYAQMAANAEWSIMPQSIDQKDTGRSVGRVHPTEGFSTKGLGLVTVTYSVRQGSFVSGVPTTVNNFNKAVNIYGIKDGVPTLLDATVYGTGVEADGVINTDFTGYDQFDITIENFNAVALLSTSGDLTGTWYEFGWDDVEFPDNVSAFLPTHGFAVARCVAPYTGSNPNNGTMVGLQIEPSDVTFFTNQTDPQTIYDRLFETTINPMRRITNAADKGVAGCLLPTGWDKIRPAYDRGKAAPSIRSALLIAWYGQDSPLTQISYEQKWNAIHEPVGYLRMLPDPYFPETFGRVVYYFKLHFSLSENPKHLEKLKQSIAKVWNNYKGGRSNFQTVIDSIEKMARVAGPVAGIAALL